MSKPKDIVRLFDVRAIERNVRQGLITRADVNKYTSSLPDVASKGVTLGEVEESEAKRTGEAPRRPVNAPVSMRSAPSPMHAIARPISAADDLDDDLDDLDDDDTDDTDDTDETVEKVAGRTNGESLHDDDDDLEDDDDGPGNLETN